jgi:hypothetical protein
MTTTTIEGRPAQLSRRIDALDARARTGAERMPRVQRHLRAASAQSGTRVTAARERLEQTAGDLSETLS